ncbi:phage baseplate assembly protein [Komagataeibacter nataicola]
MNANVKVTGAITATGDVKAGNISLDSHTHSGVEAGSANTGAPQ